MVCIHASFQIKSLAAGKAVAIYVKKDYILFAVFPVGIGADKDKILQS